ncbi:TPA: class I SAM-dependent methyltransferase [Pseudomonas aeruginosa]|uniref:class I SAM-dependent methyltransferase n=1 Tax=Pseudomonas aeruginosa TaxID=287 RepID=UPI0003BB4D1A|nr:class I SAM-dependent methyltransferase [Pseudomonas aeruginosa]EIU2706462.1 class I SAM-dependent methyltransferase [Pseudomonas aeruginosa]EKU8672111.1 class I SAM-dependent methyltransferase [Pseudomonas aeruginosa]ELD6249147.1 class I SAM-dependent methyltransferase [Pseudomonas aeruginosa]ELH1109306.1 class I SAM-dependent methyltransferase [Pseudomonas aeruginosa]ELU0706687.1 class I SAM-dependent methyltransferase [Pseudomonas aeruginosa]
MPATYHAQFSSLPSLYADMAEWAFRKEIEIPCVLQALGDITGKIILDYGCGEGTYARLLRRLGAAKVTGFDLEPSMLEKAEQFEAIDKIGVEYIQSLDASLFGTYDMVLGVYVLPYADSKRLLLSMCEDMAKILKPGGRLVTLPLHPHYEQTPRYYEKYGFLLSANPGNIDGNSVSLDLLWRGKTSTVKAWYWSCESISEALEMAGFEKIIFTNPSPSDFHDIESAPIFLRDYLKNPHAVVVSAQRKK